MTVYQNIFTRGQVRGPLYAGIAPTDVGAFPRGSTSGFVYWFGKLGDAQVGPIQLGYLGGDPPLCRVIAS